MTKVYNRKSIQPKRRELRSRQTPAEKTVWLNIRKRQIDDARFLRQYSVDNFVLDFYSPEIKLGIEIDGSSHIGKEDYDAQRQKHIESYNIRIIRFSNEQVLGNMDSVAQAIRNEVKARKGNPSNPPLLERGG